MNNTGKFGLGRASVAMLLLSILLAGCDEQIKERATLQVHTRQAVSMAFSPDGKTLASGSFGNNTITLWDVATGKSTATIKEGGHPSGIGSVAFSPDGKTLASGSHGMMKLWDVASGKNTATFQFRFEHVSSLVFSPNGKTLALGYNSIKLLDVASGKTSVVLGSVIARSVAFSPNGKTLAAGVGSQIKLWDVASGKNTATLQGHTFAVMSVAYSPDGKTLASGCADGTIKLWDVASGKNIATSLEIRQRFVCHVAFSPDGKILASGGQGILKLWDIRVTK